MKHITLSLVLLIFFTSIINAQNVSFTRLLPLPPAPQLLADIDSYEYGSNAIGDIDGDGDQDIIFTGYGFDNLTHTDIYLNDGLGNMMKKNGVNLIGSVESDLALGDIDDDGDLDLFICGADENYEAVHKLYINNGQGEFLLSEQIFAGVSEASNHLFDVDGDGDLDYFSTGLDLVNYAPQTSLYTNTNGVFTEQLETGISGVSFDKINAVDINGDSHLDLISTGFNENWESIVTAHLNDGNGVFSSLDLGLPDNLLQLEFGDIDNDGDMDLLASNPLTFNNNQIATWTNDGTGIFTQKSVISVNSKHQKFLDINMDGNLDVINFDDSCYVFLNDGNGEFEYNNSTGYTTGFYKHIRIGDFNGDSMPDILMQIEWNSSSNLTKTPICINNGNNQLYEIQPTPLAHLVWARMETFDMEGDGDLDLLLYGQHSELNPDMYLYENDGQGNFAIIDFPEGEIIRRAIFDSGDIDGDGDIDLVQTGHVGGSIDTERFNFYINDGLGNFTRMTDHGLPIPHGSPLFLDVDNDEDLDLLLGIKLFLNNGSGSFTEHNDPGIPFFLRMDQGIQAIDLDNDNDLDLIMNGAIDGLGQIKKSYVLRNDGTGHFDQINIPNINHSSGDLAAFDADGNGSIDILFAGHLNAKLWINEGTGEFTASINDDFSMGASNIEVRDYDLDGDQDVMMSGIDAEIVPWTKYLENDGSGSFTENTTLEFPGMYQGSLLSDDFDMDGKEDLIIAGSLFNQFSYTRVYLNSTCFSSSNYISLSECETYTTPSGETISQSGIYEDIIPNSFGCDSLITIDLEILTNTSSELEVITCEDYISPSGTYTWTTSGIYEDIMPNAAGCDSLVTIDLIIDEIEAEIEQLGATLSVTSAFASYQWIDCDNSMVISGAIGYEFNPSSNGNFSCILTSANGCEEETDCYNYTISGTDDLQVDFDGTISPNPFNELFNVTLKNEEDVLITIFDVSGKMVHQEKFSQTNQCVIQPEINSGIYLLQINAGSHTFMQRLIKQD